MVGSNKLDLHLRVLMAIRARRHHHVYVDSLTVHVLEANPGDVAAALGGVLGTHERLKMTLRVRVRGRVAELARLAAAPAALAIESIPVLVWRLPHFRGQ